MLTIMRRDASDEATDPVAFEALLRPLIEPGFRLACAMLHDPASAEDAVQEASVKAWRKLSQLREGSDIKPWFLGIVANECRSVWRTAWWRTLKTGEIARSAPGPEDQLLLGADLRRQLRKLSPDARLAVTAYFYLDLPIEEVARISGCSPAAAKGRLYRALQQLRPGLEPEEVIS